MMKLAFQLQIIVAANGAAGVNFEHSGVHLLSLHRVMYFLC